MNLSVFPDKYSQQLVGPILIFPKGFVISFKHIYNLVFSFAVEKNKISFSKIELKIP